MPSRTEQRRWTRDEVCLAMELYCQLEFGQLHMRHPDVRALAGLIGRRPGAVALKLVNLASMDEAIRATGRVGMANHSRLDEEVWNAFHEDWERLVRECVRIRASRAGAETASDGRPDDLGLADFEREDYSGDTRSRVVEARLGQDFFRRAVLSSYRSTCCMSGIRDARLLVASHIRPWRDDRANRLNPRNGLCLSALHDRAFDRWLLAVAADNTILVSSQLERADDFTRNVFRPLRGQPIRLPEKFLPDPALLAFHRERFVA